MGYKMAAPMGCAKRAVGTMLAIRKPIERMKSVERREGPHWRREGRELSARTTIEERWCARYRGRMLDLVVLCMWLT